MQQNASPEQNFGAHEPQPTTGEEVMANNIWADQKTETAHDHPHTRSSHLQTKVTSRLKDPKGMTFP